MAERPKTDKKPALFARMQTAYAAFVNGREKGLIGRQRLAVYIYSTLIVAIGIPLNLLGWTGPENGFYTALNTAHLIVAVSLFAGYCLRRIPLTWALGTLIVATHLEIAGEMLFSAFHPSDYRMMLIVANMILATVTVMLALVAYMRYLPYIACALMMGTYIACACITQSPSLWNFSLLFVLIFSIVALLGERLVKNIHILYRENEILRQEEYAIMELLELDKKQMMAFAELSKGEADDVRTTELMDMIGKDARRNLYASARRQIRQEQTRMDAVKRQFPELTHSEQEICRLILQGKKLSEMCDMLHKTRGNITSQRAHIREKLGLDRKDDLKSALQKRMKGDDNCASE